MPLGRDSSEEPCNQMIADRRVSEEPDLERLRGGVHGQNKSYRPTIYLCRHGATALNAGARLRGLSDPALNATGRQQADGLAMTLQPTKPRAVAASPLRRAVQTAEVIAAACGLTVEVSGDLLDRDYGPQNGQLLKDVIDIWGDVDNAPGVEPREAVLARARSALAKASPRIMHGPIVLVSHDAINSALLAFLDPRRWPAPNVVPQPTGCLNVLQRDRYMWNVVIAGLRPSAPVHYVPDA
jgi:broad specificity phosphatase PhoE